MCFVFLNKYFRQYFKCKLQHKVCLVKKEMGVEGVGCGVGGSDCSTNVQLVLVGGAGCRLQVRKVDTHIHVNTH